MKLLFLLADVFSYNFAVLDILQKKYEHEIHLIHWNKNSGSNIHMSFYNPNYNIYNKPNTFQDLEILTESIKPDIIIVAGWMDLNYLKIAFKNRKKGIKVICSMDTQYDYTLKQKLASLILNLSFIRKFFYTNAWVPGFPQFESAIRFGFKRNEIFYGLLSADTNIFKKSIVSENTSKIFLFVGRLEKEKGVDILINSWKLLSKNFPDWHLNIVGDGSLKNDLSNLHNVHIKGFLNPTDVAYEMNLANCLLLPSLYEPWGLVLHEAVLCGLPVICTRKCGSQSSFVIDNFNGFVIKENNKQELTNSMYKIINLSPTKYIEFSNSSLILGSQISSLISAAHLNAGISFIE